MLVMQFIVAGEWGDTRMLPQFRVDDILLEKSESDSTTPMAFMAGAATATGERVFVANTTWRDAFPVHMNALNLGSTQVNAIDFGSVVRETKAVYARFLDDYKQPGRADGGAAAEDSFVAQALAGTGSFFADLVADLLAREVRGDAVGEIGHATNDAFFRHQRLGKVWERLFRDEGSSLTAVQRAIIDGANAYFANNPCKNLRRFNGTVTAESLRVWVAFHSRGSSHPPHVHVSLRCVLPFSSHHLVCVLCAIADQKPPTLSAYTRLFVLIFLNLMRLIYTQKNL